MIHAVKALKTVAALVFVAAAGYVLYTQAAPLLIPPCSEPIEYVVGEVDSRFGLSDSQLRVALANAASIWNEAAGKTVVIAGEGKDAIPVSLVYGDEQKTVELGESIDAEQAQYDAKKADVMALKEEFSATKARYESSRVSYERKVAAYDADVRRWNAEGGAPPSEYQALNARARSLEEERKELNEDAEAVNDAANDVNAAVSELNALARKINARVNTYNKSAGTDFEQGNYKEDKDGKRITIYEMKDTKDLTRVLAHEFGHALGIEHVENPDSVMYSFNIGEGFALSEEDVAALKAVCRLN